MLSCVCFVFFVKRIVVASFVFLVYGVDVCFGVFCWWGLSLVVLFVCILVVL